MTIGDTIWADAVRDTGILVIMTRSRADADRWREFALAVIRAIDESHGILGTPEDEEPTG